MEAAIIFFLAVAALAVIGCVVHLRNEEKYKELSAEVLKHLGISGWGSVPYFDSRVVVKSRQTLEKYDDIKLFKENPNKLHEAKRVIAKKSEIAQRIKVFLRKNDYAARPQYNRVETQVRTLLKKRRCI